MNLFFTNILTILILLISQPVNAKTDLLKIRRAGDNDSVQVYFTFNELPSYSQTQKAKRIDIVFETYLTISNEIVFPTDDKIVKFLTQVKEGKTILTFFLRYEPQQVKLAVPQKNTLVLDILLGNQFSKAYPDLSARLEGVTIVTQKGEDYANPYISSPYANNWRSFFSKYEPLVSTFVPFTFTTPPFPIINLLPDAKENASSTLNEEFFILAKQDRWEDMIPLLLDLIKKASDPSIKKHLALTFGEILLRAGNFSGAFKQLYLLKNKYKHDPVGILAEYLLIRLRAEYEDPFIADVKYRNLEEHIDEDLPIAPYFYLSQIETSLATNQLDRSKEIIAKDNVAFPGETEILKELRQTDYWYASGDYIKAYVGYQLLADKKLLEKHPYSLNGYCDTLYRQKKFQQSSDCFQKLSSVVDDKNQLSIIAFKKAMAELHYKNAREQYAVFSTIEDTYPGTVAAFRAAIKKTDIHYLSQPSWQKTSAKHYQALFEKAANREIAEEAALKEAIVYALLDNKTKSIDLLIEFLRNFRKGKLKSTAQALLIEILPAEIEKLISEENYIQALILAKKNRTLFQKNWVDINLLSFLAKAYHELSIYDEAKKLYIYLLKTSNPQLKEQYYLSLISIYYTQGQYGLVEDYAAQYNYNYPDGIDRDEIFLYRLKSLMANDQNRLAINLISTSTLPDILAFREIAAQLYYSENMFDQVIETLSPYFENEQILSMESKFILAESNFQTKNFGEAERFFNIVKDENVFFDQSRYRLAIMEKNKGQEQKALKLFVEIVEKGNDPLWQKLARKILEFQSLSKKY